MWLRKFSQQAGTHCFRIHYKATQLFRRDVSLKGSSLYNPVFSIFIFSSSDHASLIISLLLYEIDTRYIYIINIVCIDSIDYFFFKWIRQAKWIKIANIYFLILITAQLFNVRICNPTIFAFPTLGVRLCFHPWNDHIKNIWYTCVVLKFRT